MDTWIEQKGYPLITVIRDQHTGKIKITQEYFQPYKKIGVHKNLISIDITNIKWWVPINFATRTDPNFSSTLATHWLSPKVEELIIDGIDPQDWIIVNVQQTGKIDLYVFYKDYLDINSKIQYSNLIIYKFELY